MHNTISEKQNNVNYQGCCFLEITKCKNDKPFKNQVGKAPAPLPLRRPVPAPYFHLFF